MLTHTFEGLRIVQLKRHFARQAIPNYTYESVVPAAHVKLIQSVSVPPHQSVVAEMKLEDGCWQGSPLLFCHDEALEVLSGLSPDDALIQPSRGD